MKPDRKTVELKFTNPTVVSFDPGHFKCLIEEKAFGKVLADLREHKLPTEKSPYADNKNDDVKKLAWSMKKIAKGNLDEEMKWLIDVLHPRIHMEWDSGPKPRITEIEEVRSHPLVEFIYDPTPFSMRKTDAVMTAGTLLAQPKVPLFDSEYRLAICQEEICFLATAIMRANEREAYPVGFVLPNLDMFFGTAVFPNESTMVTFHLSRTHPPVASDMLISDKAATSLIVLASARNMYKKAMFEAAEIVRNGGDIGEDYVNAKIAAIRKRAEVATKYWAGNPMIKPFIESLESKPDEQAQVPEGMDPEMMQKAKQPSKKEEALFKDIKRSIDDLLISIDERGGIAKKKLFGYSKGMLPSEIEERMKSILSRLDKGLTEHGADSLPLLQLAVLARGLVDVEFPSKGLPNDSLNKVRQYLAPVLRKLSEYQNQ